MENQRRTKMTSTLVSTMAVQVAMTRGQKQRVAVLLMGQRDLASLPFAHPPRDEDVEVSRAGMEKGKEMGLEGLVHVLAAELAQQALARPDPVPSVLPKIKE